VEAFNAFSSFLEASLTNGGDTPATAATLSEDTARPSSSAARYTRPAATTASFEDGSDHLSLPRTSDA